MGFATQCVPFVPPPPLLLFPFVDGDAEGELLFTFALGVTDTDAGLWDIDGLTGGLTSDGVADTDAGEGVIDWEA